MFGSLFKVLGVLLVVGGIFFAGMMTGGAFANESAETGVLDRIEDCLPAKTMDQLQRCMAVDDATGADGRD